MDAPRLMRDCPRYNTCSIPICPLDPDWAKRTMLSNEPTCPWLTESVKADAVANFEMAGVPDLLPWVRLVRDDIGAKFGKIRQTMAAAADTSSKIANAFAAGERLRKLNESESEDAP